MDHTAHHHSKQSLKSTAFSATLHCLIGCSIGEVLGMLIGIEFHLSNFVTIIISIILAFLFGYTLAFYALRKANLTFRQALPIVLTAETVSITVMELVDNAMMLLIPGAMEAHYTDILFWISMIISFAIAFVVTFPVNMYLISRGKGHAVMHKYH